MNLPLRSMRRRDAVCRPRHRSAWSGGVAEWAETNNVEGAYIPTGSSWLNRFEAQFTALRYFALDGSKRSVMLR